MEITRANTTTTTSTTTLMSRSLFGGVLMGLANLVPGISGGTMLLAAGIYPSFVDAVAAVTRLRFSRKALLVLGLVVGSALISILLLAGTLKDLVVDYRWIMYSLFIGLTLGGIPVVWRLAGHASKALVLAAAIAFLAMVAVAVMQASGVVGSSPTNPLVLLVAGLAGASAMILPGISGGYLLLLMGQYVPILSAIDAFKEALRAQDFSAAFPPAFSVLLPVGLGVVTGVALIGNLLAWMLKNHQQSMLGILLGLLVGSTAGLWPFQVGVPPQLGDRIKGQVVTEATIATIPKEDWKADYFQPTLWQAGCSLLLVAAGFAITLTVAKIGQEPTKTGVDHKVESTPAVYDSRDTR